MLYSFIVRYSTHFLFFFFFNDTATTEIYTLSLHDALPIFPVVIKADEFPDIGAQRRERMQPRAAADIQHSLSGEIGQLQEDRKSTRLNSSHVRISYAVFCLKKKKKKPTMLIRQISELITRY